MTGSTREHWELIYRSKGDQDLSWFEPTPGRALELLDAVEEPITSAVDIGGGQSLVAFELVRRGVERVMVLDISAAAIERARARMGEKADRITWLVADVVADPPPALATVDLWHDRAAFHFLTDPALRARYARLAAATVRPGGHLLISTFALAGPERCSGLPVVRQDAAGLASEFAPSFVPVRSLDHTHTTPWGKPQAFVNVLLRRAEPGEAGRNHPTMAR